MSAKCVSCGASIFWAESITSGKKMPMDATPDPEGGTFSLIDRTDENPLAEFVRAEDRHREPRLYACHFATCTDAPAYRRGR